MRKSVSKGVICLKDRLNLEYKVCRIEYHLNEDETFEYRFYPNYRVIDILTSDIYQGIPGLNLDLRREVYIRSNLVPVFISERVPQPNREDYYELLQKVGMTYMDPIEFLIRDKERYSGDYFYVKSYEEPKKVNIEKKKGKANAFGLTKLILQEIASNNEVYLKEDLLDDPSVFKTLHYLYEMQYQTLKEKQKEGINKAKQSGRFRGRKPIHVNELAFYEVLEKVERKEMTNKEAAALLVISIDKYYRLKKTLQNKKDTPLQ